MNGNNQTAWSEIWWLAFFVTLLVVPIPFTEGHWEGGVALLVVLFVEFFMLLLPEIWESWKRNAPNRQRARAARRERAAAQAQLRAEQDEARRQRQADQAERREAKAAEARARREVVAACKEAQTYYRANAALLRHVLPPELFKAEIEAVFISGISPADAWRATRDLIAKLVKLVAEGKDELLHEERQEQPAPIISRPRINPEDV